MQFTGLSRTELRQLTWRQLVHYFDRGMDYQRRYALPLAYQAKPELAIEFLKELERAGRVDGPAPAGIAVATTHEEFEKKRAAMMAKAAHNTIDSESLQALRELSKEL